MLDFSGLERDCSTRYNRLQKTDPKDVDILITTDDADLKALATAARRPKEQHKERIEAPTLYL